MCKTKYKLDGILISTFISTFFYSVTSPKILYTIMQYNNSSDDLLAIVNIINCVGIIIAGQIWNRYSDKLFKFYPGFLILESACIAGVSIFAITTQKLVAYYIINALIIAIISRHICCGYNKLRAIRYTTKETREKFDNNNNSLEALATILGSSLAIILPYSFATMLIIAAVGNIIDNTFYINIFYKTINK